MGILNGVDQEIWHPSCDAYIQHHYKLKSIAGKKKNKADLQAYFNLPQQPDALVVFVMVTRLTEQKGVDLLIATADEIVKQGGQLTDSRFWCKTFGRGNLPISTTLPRKYCSKNWL